MKATELMVGDWVLDGKKPAQITGIMCDDLFETTLSPSVGGECITPIPLTDEIMEENFPIYEKGYTVGWWTDEFGNAGPFWFELTANGVQIEIKSIKYVHELQHALRLCGINKEIEL